VTDIGDEQGASQCMFAKRQARQMAEIDQLRNIAEQQTNFNGQLYANAFNLASLDTALARQVAEMRAEHRMDSEIADLKHKLGIHETVNRDAHLGHLRVPYPSPFPPSPYHPRLTKLARRTPYESVPAPGEDLTPADIAFLEAYGMM